jgi:hypothetical protein
MLENTVNETDQITENANTASHIGVVMVSFGIFKLRDLV